MYDYVNGEGLAAAAAEIKSRIGSGSASAGGLQIEKYVDEQVNGCVSVSTLPYEFYQGSAVVLNGEIHILGSRDDSNTPTRDKYHYKYNGTSWERVSTLPYEFYQGSAVVLNGQIHILGSSYYNRSSKSYSYAKYHYKFNGTSWERVSTLPYEFYQGSAVVLNGQIHILGSDDTSYADYHYKYNGSSWTSVSTLPYDFSNGSAVVLNNEIHILSSDYYNNGYPYAKYHYKYNGSSWTSVSTLPSDFLNGSAVVLNDEIHILGGLSHYVFNGTSWRKTYDAPYDFRYGSAVVLNDGIHILGGAGSGHYTNHFLIRPDNRHIATMLPKGTHIMLSDNEDINYVKNAKKASSNIAEVTENGYVEVLATLPEIDDIKGYLTFY